MEFLKSIDERLKSIGFIKMEGKDKENEYGASYRRNIEKYNYTQRLDIVHKCSGKHLILSYDENNPINDTTSNYAVGLTYQEIKLILKKYQQLKRRYKW